MTKEVAKKQNTEVAVTDFDSFSGKGFGHQDSTDFLIPRIAVLNDLSPQLKKNKAEYVEGAESGDIVDVAMGEMLAKQGNSFSFLPVVRVKEVIEWLPKRQGMASRNVLNETMDSYAGQLGVERNSKFEYFLDNGNELIETHQYYGLNLNADCRWSFIPMKKSNLKIARKWFTKATAIKLPNGNQAPLFYKTYEIGSFLDSGNENEFYNWKVSDGPLLQEYSDDWQLIFNEAVKLLNAVEGGTAIGDVTETNVDDDVL